MDKSQKQRVVFSIVSEYLTDIQDLSRLRIALNGDKHMCLFNGWMDFLKHKHNPLTFRLLLPEYLREEACLTELLEKHLMIAWKEIKTHEPHQQDPFHALVKAIESCKEDMDGYIVKAKGPMPGKFTDELEEWAYFDPHTNGYQREIMYEDFWKGGGREGEAPSKKFQEWRVADEYMKERWTGVLNDSLSVIEEGRGRIDKTLKTRLGRRLFLTDELKKQGLDLRADSVLCNQFINCGAGEVSTIVQTMMEMNFLYNETDYHLRVRNKGRNTSIEVVKLIAVKDFLQNHPERAKEVPITLMNKAKKRYKQLDIKESSVVRD